MEVVLISHSTDPEITCAVSMRSCRTEEPAHVLLKKLKWEARCRDYKDLYDRAVQKIDALDTGKRHIKYNACKYFDGEKCPFYECCAERLLNKAKKMKHWGVLEFAEYIISVSGVSRSLTHQLVRHRLFSYLQQSLRVVDPTEAGVVLPHTIKESGVANSIFFELIDRSKKAYKELQKMKIPNQDARFALLIGIQTHIVIKGNARNWLHFFSLRLAKPAQWEIREMAKAIRVVLMEKSPLIFEGAGEYQV